MEISIETLGALHLDYADLFYGKIFLVIVYAWAYSKWIDSHIEYTNRTLLVER